MTRYFLPISPTIKSVVALLIIPFVAAAAVGTRVWLSSEKVSAGVSSPAFVLTAAAPAPVPAQENPAGGRLEAERVTLRPTGFEPAEVTRPAGRFLLAVNDRSGLDGVTLMLIRDNGQRLHEMRLPREARRRAWRQVVNLPPGEYVLSEANHPDWVCRITVTR